MALNRFVHQEILIALLKEIFTDDVLSASVAFKGGTAAMLFYGLDRFSVDLDFDLLTENEDVVCSRMDQLLESHGTVKSEKKRFCLFFLLSYEGKLEKDQNVKVEINRRGFGSRYEVKLFMGIPMRVMVQEDMTAHKLVAMYERLTKTNRDMYDVWFFFKHHWPINKHIVETRTGMKYSDFLKNCIDALEQMSDRSILSGLGELLTPNQKVWVKANLRKETIFQLQLAYRSELASIGEIGGFNHSQGF